MMNPKDLRNRLESLDKAELIDLISGVYEIQDVREEIEEMPRIITES